MILPILLYTNKLLNTVCKPVTDFEDPSLQDFVSNMLETMTAYNGVGLAANQVGKDLQICTLDVENRTKKMVLANPRIVSYSKKKIKLNEACLSCPGLSVELKRPESVIVEANLLTGELVKYQFDGFDSRILFHEVGHLQGICISRAVQNYGIVV
jgi:peptide deformylase